MKKNNNIVDPTEVKITINPSYIPDIHDKLVSGKDKTTEDGLIIPGFFDPNIISSAGSVKIGYKYESILKDDKLESIYGAFNNVMMHESAFINGSKDPKMAFVNMLDNPNDIDSVYSSIAYRRETICEIFRNRLKFSIINFIRYLYENCGIAFYTNYKNFEEKFKHDVNEEDYSDIIAQLIDDAVLSSINYYTNDNREINNICNYKFNLVNILLDTFKKEFINDMTNLVITDLYNTFYKEFVIKCKFHDCMINQVGITQVFVSGRDVLFDLLNSLYTEACDVYYYAGYFDVFPVVKYDLLKNTIAHDPFFNSATNLANGRGCYGYIADDDEL